MREEGRRVIAVSHHYDLRHGYYFFFNIFPSGRAGKNPQPPLLPLMRISAPDTAASGVDMMVWEEGGGLLYLLKISRRGCWFIHLNYQHVQKTTENTEGTESRRVIAVCAPL